jgi:hypothetical protein
MNTPKMLMLYMLLLVLVQGKTQTETPKGFSKGNIVLSDGTELNGLIKEKIRGNTSLTFLGDDNKKKNYDGSDLRSAVIGNDQFICIKGDFFRVAADGELKLLQKSSDASTKPMYNGSQAVFGNGTAGSPGDYFLYTKDKQLKLVSRKTVNAVAAETFAGCDDAISKAKLASDDLSHLSDAVVSYNNWKGK